MSNDSELHVHKRPKQPEMYYEITDVNGCAQPKPKNQNVHKNEQSLKVIPTEAENFCR